MFCVDAESKLRILKIRLKRFVQKQRKFQIDRNEVLVQTYGIFRSAEVFTEFSLKFET